jgi:hypothetical protein
LSVTTLQPVASQTVSVRGVVGDSSQALPLADALILLDQGVDSAVTDFSGEFTFSALSPGSHTLSVISFGFESQEFRMTVRAEDGADQEIGLIALRALPSVRVRFEGVIMDSVINEGVEDAEVVLGGMTSTRTNAAGGFAIEEAELQPGYYMALVRAVGYRSTPLKENIA